MTIDDNDGDGDNDDDDDDYDDDDTYTTVMYIIEWKQKSRNELRRKTMRTVIKMEYCSRQKIS